MPAPAQTPYCDVVGVQSRAGMLAVDLRIDDDPSTIDDCISRASADIDLRLRSRHPAADFTLVPWVYWCCVSLATRHLCRRRLNPVPDDLNDECNEYEAQMKELAAGTLTLASLPRAPGGVAVSNQHVQHGARPQLGVDRGRSSKTSDPARRRFDRGADLLPPWGNIQ